MERMRALSKAKGCLQDWIDKRMRGIAIRNDHTAEWDERGTKRTKFIIQLLKQIRIIHSELFAQ